ncbi:hypothetical protein [Bacteroides sp. An51A]|uniref:hypothetical protein n=1 Tax=Bacteroides sp. An51A TaxID=1965640 RepID=UPI000B36AAC6|nr:hypothetical protein [Bacteroides sp. An51A]OUN77857.1 hypothetical protein B5G04_16755 [Bacteroides sp. An51A]
MKNFYFVCATLVAGFFMSSCTQDDGIVKNSVRDTHTDMEILSRFIDINEATNEYYLNENKKTRALSYVTNSDFEELEKVSPVNVEKCQKELNELNAKVAQAMADPNIAYLVLSVEGKTVVKNVRKANFEFKLDDNVKVIASRAIPSTLMVYGGSTQTTNEFLDATRTIRMSVIKDSFVSGYYYFTVNSKNAKVNPDDNTTTPETVAFSGTGSLWNTYFTWTSYADSEAMQDGKYKWEFKATGITPSSGTIATLNFSK